MKNIAQIEQIGEVKSTRKRKFLFIPLKHFFPYIGLLLGILLFIFQQSLVTYSEKIIGSFMMNYIQYETRGEYTIDYDHVRLSIFKQELYLAGFEFKKDSLNLTTRGNQNNVGFKASILSLNIKNLLRFFIYREIEVEKLELRKPILKIVLDKTSGESKQDKKGILNAITQYLNDFQINKLSITNARIDYKEIRTDTTFKISFADISLHVSQFRLGESVSPEGKNILSQEFEIELLNEKLEVLPGHYIEFDRLNANSKDSIMIIENLRISPVSKSLSNSYNLEMPQIQIKHFDLPGIIQRERVKAGTLDLGTFHLNLRMGFNQSGNATKSRSMKMKGITEIYFEDIITEYTNINITFPIDPNLEQTLVLRDLDLHLENMKIDSLTLNDPSILISNIDYILNIGSYEAVFEGIDHTVKIYGIHNSFKEGLFRIDGFELTPNSDNLENRIILTGGMMEIQGLNFPSAILDGNLIGKEALINNPEIRIYFEKTVKETSDDKSEDISYRNIYPLIQNVFPRLQLDQIELINSTLFIKENSSPALVSGENINILLRDILIDSSTVNNPYQFLGIKDIFISGKKFFTGSPDGKEELSVGSIMFDTKQGELTVEDLDFTSRSEYVDNFQVERIELDGLEWFNAIYNDKIIIDSIKVINPSLMSSSDTLYVPSDSVILSATPYFPNSVSIRQFSITGGEIELTEYAETIAHITGIGSQASYFSLTKHDPYILWNTKNFYLENGPFNMILPDDSHSLSGGAISYSKSDSVLRINQLKIQPTNQPNDVYQLNIDIPNILITNVVGAQFLDSGYLDVNEIKLLNPSIDVLLTPGDVKQKSESKKEGDFGSHFFIDKVSIVNGDVQVTYSKNVSHDLTANSFDLEFEGIVIDSLTKFDNSLSFIDHLGIKASNVNYSGIEGLDSVFIGGLEFRSESHITSEQVVIKRKDPTSSMETRVNKISLYGDDWLRKILRREYSFDSLIVTYPDIKLTLVDTAMLAENDSMGVSSNSRNLTKAQQRVYRQFGRKSLTQDSAQQVTNEEDFRVSAKEQDVITKTPGFEDSIQISTVKLNSGKFQLDNKGKIFMVPDFNVRVEKLNYQKNNENKLHSEDIFFEASNLQDLLNSDLNDLGIDVLRVSTKDRSVSIEGLKLKPKVNKLEYGWKVGHQTDWMTVNGNSIIINGIDFEQLIDGEIHLQEIYIDSLDIEVFRDKNVPFPVDQTRYMPQKMISDIKVPLNIEVIILNHADVKYEELDSEAEQAGFIEFKNMTVGMQNISNDSASLVENNILLIAANTDVMGQGNLQADMEFDLTDPDYKHKYRGFLSAMDLTGLNNILEPNVRIRIKSGQLNKMEFNVEGDDYYAVGEMEMMYDDLHINLISKKRGTTSAMGPAMGSFFANTFFISRNNPRFLFVRRGDIYAERDTTKSVFNYMSKTALSGVVSSIGAKNNRKEIRKANKEARENRDKKKRRDKKRKEEKSDGTLTTSSEEIE